MRFFLRKDIGSDPQHLILWVILLEHISMKLAPYLFGKIWPQLHYHVGVFWGRATLHCQHKDTTSFFKIYLILKFCSNEGTWLYFGEKPLHIALPFPLPSHGKLNCLCKHGLLAQVWVVSLAFSIGFKIGRSFHHHMRNKVANFLQFCIQKGNCTVTSTIQVCTHIWFFWWY